MPLLLPEIPEAEATPLVLQLLEIIRSQQQRLQQLEDELVRLKGLKTRPVIAPSRLETPPPRPPQPGQKRPGSHKRPKNAQLQITDEVIIKLQDVPSEATFKGYEDFLVQDLILRPQVTRYRRERWQTTDGRTLVAALPVEVVPGSHFGPELICFILHQYHHQHVTQPLLLEQLLQIGIDISAGQLSRILTEKTELFDREKDELLPAALEVSSYVQVDDTGARHQGRNGYCTHIGNEPFALFESTSSKSRLNFLEILRRPHNDYVINDEALAYFERQELAEAVREKLDRGPREFADRAAWDDRLRELAITAERHVRIATEGALLGGLIAHGVSPALAILSDGAPQFDVLVHAACWLHAERPLTRMIPYSDEHRTAIERVRERIWDLYKELKAYRKDPEEAKKPVLEARFDAICGERMGFPSIDGVLKEMREHRADLLRVLERPEIPLHNNLSEGHIRDYVKKRKISGSTRSEAGRRARDTFASLKKTCRRLGVNFLAYLRDRVRGLGQIVRLEELIRQKGEEQRPCREGARLPNGAVGGVVV